MSNIYRTADIFGRVFTGIERILIDADDYTEKTVIQICVNRNENNIKQLKSLKAKKYHETLITEIFQYINEVGEEYFIEIDKH